MQSLSCLFCILWLKAMAAKPFCSRFGVEITIYYINFTMNFIEHHDFKFNCRIGIRRVEEKKKIICYHNNQKNQTWIKNNYWNKNISFGIRLFVVCDGNQQITLFFHRTPFYFNRRYFVLTYDCLLRHFFYLCYYF